MSGGTVSIKDTLETIENGSSAAKRNTALINLRHVLRHNQSSSIINTINDKSFRHIYEVLFRVIGAELPGWIKSKKSTSDTRLLGCAEALRLAVEVGVRRLKAPSVKLLLAHLTKDLLLPTGGLCAPLALDYAKALRAVASHQPHVEHLSQAEWEKVATLCVKAAQVNSVSTDHDIDSDDEHTPNSSRANLLSYRSSRSIAKGSEASQSQGASLGRGVADELVECLQLLTSAPNAVFKNTTSLMLRALTDILRSSALRKCHISALRSVNNLLSWIRTENSSLMHIMTPQLIRLIRQFWPHRSSSTPAKDDMIITLAYLQPYVEKAMRGHDNTVMADEVSRLVDVLRPEYMGRLLRDQLQLDDLVLVQGSVQNQAEDTINLSLFGLGCAGHRAESSWALLDTLSFLCAVLDHATSANDPSGDGAENHQRPPKRQKTSAAWEDLLSDTSSGDSTSRIAALQTLLFLLEKQAFSARCLQKVLDALVATCSEEDGTLTSWAFNVLTVCAAQAASAHSSLSSNWTTIWQVATRAMSNPSACRAASYLLSIMVLVQLVNNSTVSAFIQSLSISIDLKGPSIVADSVCYLLAILLRRAQELTPSSTALLAENVLRWSLRTAIPANLEDKTFNAMPPQYQSLDLVALVWACLGSTPVLPVGRELIAWDKVAQAIIRCKEQNETITYVLMLPTHDIHLHAAMQLKAASKRDATMRARANCETAVLVHYVAEIQRERIFLKGLLQDHAVLSIGSFRLLLTQCCAAAILAYDIEYRDKRSQDALKNEVSTLLNTLAAFMASTSCDEVKLHAGVIIVSRTCMVIPDPAQEISVTAGQRILCLFLHQALSARETAVSQGAFDPDDLMDLDDDFDSQNSQPGVPKAADDFEVLRNDGSMVYSTLAHKTTVTLYAAVIAALAEAEKSPDRSQNATEVVVDCITQLSGLQLFAARPALCALLELGLNLGASETERLLEYCTKMVLDPYTHRRSEVALGTMLDVMSHLQHLWMDHGNKSLYDLGLQLYSWFAGTASTAGVFSPKVERRLATLLLRIIHRDPTYGENKIDEDDISINDRLFKLIQISTVEVQFFIGSRIASIFGLFTLPQHESIFYDLEKSLPNDMEQVEEMATRLLFFAQIGASWHTILRQCVYHIFETAGRYPRTQAHATRAMSKLGASLGFASSRQLFRLFAPQLVFTWLEANSLTGLPYVCFEYKSLEALICDNRVEIFAQLMCQEDNEAGMQVITAACQMTKTQLAQVAFARTQAYALSWDVQDSGRNGKHINVRESRVQEALMSKENHVVLCHEQFAAIMGQFFLTLQLSVQKRTKKDDPSPDSNDLLYWFRRNGAYISAANALEEMVSYGSSVQDLPNDQQPSFRPSFLVDNIARLCRRVRLDAANHWEPWRFALTARMVIDSIDDSLGPLHKTLVLRRLRVLIAMAGSIPFSGHPLEVLLHSIRPYLSVEECADDALGILKFLLLNAEDYLTANTSTTLGLILLMVLQMSQFSRGRQSSTTQESQFQRTTAGMKGFRTWLMNYLNRLQKNLDASNRSTEAACATLQQTLPDIELPGNAMLQSRESRLLEFILADTVSSTPILSHGTTVEALRLLTKDFVGPQTIGEDFMGNDEVCCRYAPSLAKVLQEGSWSNGFLLWSSLVLGRAYASSGRKELLSTAPVHANAHTADREVSELLSESLIIARLSQLVSSGNQASSGVAEYTLRRAYGGLCEHEGFAEESERFHQALPIALRAVIQGGTQGYQPTNAVDDAAYDDPPLEAVQRALGLRPEQDHMAWTIELVAALCRYAAPLSPLLAALPAALTNVPQLAVELASQVIHILLMQDYNESVIKQEISNSMMAHFVEREAALRPKQELFLKTLLYLRCREYPQENNPADRLKWLSIEWQIAAEAAASCGIPTTALLLAESGRSAIATGDTAKRSSSRRSMSQAPSAAQIPSHLLLSIFEQVDEPDSFYGVQQSASIDSVLARLDYEGNGYRSLMFRSAQMDVAMRKEHRFVPESSAGMMKSLAALNFDSLAFALMSGPMTEVSESSASMLQAAQKLQQWDIGAPSDTTLSGAASFAALQHLSRATDLATIKGKLDVILLEHLSTWFASRHHVTASWSGTLASVTEIRDILSGTGQRHIESCWQRMEARQNWMDVASIEDSTVIVSDRQDFFSILAQNKVLMDILRVGAQTSRLLEAKSLVRRSQLARSHGILQEALSSASQLTALSSQGASVGLSFSAVAKVETASVLWDIGEATASVHMLRDLLELTNTEKESIAVGRSGLLAQLGYQLADARLEKPDDILREYLEPAIKHLQQRTEGKEAGKVFHAYAIFCDRQLQSPAAMEDLNRIATLRQKKFEEKVELEQMLRRKSGGSKEKDGLTRSLNQAAKWFRIDDEEYQRLMRSRNTFVKQSLHYYLLSLSASDEHNISALRFFALWLENSEVEGANDIVHKHLQDVPSWKFVLLLNQLMSRLEKERNVFQDSLKALVTRMCETHPYHSLHHLFASTRASQNMSGPAMSRYEAAANVRKFLESSSRIGDLLTRFFRGDNYYHRLASLAPPRKDKIKFLVSQWPDVKNIVDKVASMKLPPATVSLALRPDGNYTDAPTITGFEQGISIMGGISAPKALKARATDGNTYHQLFKGGNDDLRQDAIMEQVFEETSKMLGNHKDTRKRNLRVRTYKVIPLTPSSGIIEFVPNSKPFDTILKDLHRRYYPQDISHNVAAERIEGVKAKTTDERLKEYRRICDEMHPVLRHHFFEKFQDPDDWFKKRTAYTRTTAAISMMGHVIGLGDRHNSNVLLDEETGEVVHIDLGISFEAGKVLPIPETVPFRLTRDVVDAMGATKTEGIFRRCCEFTLDALRDDKDSIMTLLNVLRYDPLHNWTLSPVRARRAQNASETNQANGVAAGLEVQSSKRKEQETAEADRALAAVERKLAKTLSTAATVNELIQQATDERNLAVLFRGWAAFF